MKKGLLLLSGGIDSPVAGYLMKDKLELEALHFSLEPYTNDESIKKSKLALKILGIKKLHIIPHGRIQAKIADKCIHKYYYVITKRLMFKTAEKFAEKINCEYLITGENLAQVSSQTLPNLITINKCIQLPILRPLLTFDKNEIIDIAKKIGSFEISKGPETCNILGPNNPSTNVPEKIIKLEEAKIKEDLIKEGLTLIRTEKIN